MAPSPEVLEALSWGNGGEIVALLLSQHNLSTIFQFTTALCELSEKYPYRTDTYASTCATALLSSKIDKYTVPGAYGSPDELFRTVFNRQIWECIKDFLYATASTGITQDNKYLAACLLAGSAIRVDLCMTPAQNSEVEFGLRYPDSDYEEFIQSGEGEIRAVGASIIALTAGPLLFPFGREQLKKQLQEATAFVNDEVGLKVVKAAHEHVAAGTALTPLEVWRLMFPDFIEDGNS